MARREEDAEGAGAMRDMLMVRCAIYRGGTSRGVFFRENDLPPDREARARILLAAFGSPDGRQIDGLGGATSQTSKAMLVGPSRRPGADIESTFGQVDIAHPLVDWGGNCGNMTAAVGPFAIDEGLVCAVEPATTVRIYNTNTQKTIVATVPTSEGRALAEGDYVIPGVPFPGARVDLEFMDPGGSLTGRLLPTGHPTDVLTLADGRRLTVSLVDAANPVVFTDAAELGLTGTELPAELEAHQEAMATLEELRAIAAEMLGLVKDRRQAKAASPGLPKVGYVTPPRAFQSTPGATIPAEAMDIQGRLLSMGTAHRSYPVTGAICTAAAAVVKGTLVHAASRATVQEGEPTVIRIAHPYGVMDVRVRWEIQGGESRIQGATVGRTARRIMEGYVYVPRGRLAV